MMNGMPGQRICHARGLRQGDPLSPLLFILVMETLSSMIRLADCWQLFDKVGINSFPHRASLYADDLIMFVSPAQRDLDITRKILDVFERASGLGCNLHKCQIVPIRCTPKDITRVTSLFLATVSEFPIRYLGVPLSVTKLPKAALQPLVDKVADRVPTFKGKLLHSSGRLALLKSTLSAIPVDIMINLELPPWAI